MYAYDLVKLYILAIINEYYYREGRKESERVSALFTKSLLKSGPMLDTSLHVQPHQHKTREHNECS